jgi:hypothetical protein
LEERFRQRIKFRSQDPLNSIEARELDKTSWNHHYISTAKRQKYRSQGGKKRKKLRPNQDI